MTESFDPYRKWLGIPSEEQPPHHYRMLGIGLYEDDPDVIESAADRQMAHVQTKRSGKHVQLTQKLLNELAAAKLCLLNRDKKAAYDSELKQKLAPPAQAAPPARTIEPPQANALPPAAVPAAKPARPAEEPVVVRKPTQSVARRGRKSSGPLLLYAIAAVAAITVIGAMLIVAAVIGGTGDADPPIDVAQNNHSPIATSPIDDSGPETRRDQLDGRPQRSLDAQESPEDAQEIPSDSDIRPNPFAEQADSEKPTEDPVTEPKDTPANESPDTTDPVPDPETLPISRDLDFTWKRNPFDGRIDLRQIAASLTVHPKFPPASEIASIGEKHGVPSTEAFGKAKALVDEVYETEIAAAQTEAEKISLAASMVAKAAAEDESPTTQYALLQTALELADEAGEIATSFAIIDLMSARFEIDRVSMKSDLVLSEGRQLNPNASVSTIANGALILVEQAIIVEQFDLADDLSEAGLTAAKQSRNASLIRTAEAIQAELPKLKEQHKPYRDGIHILKTWWKNRPASTKVARYVCFAMGDWEAGLPRLAFGDVQELADAAKMDLELPEEAEAQAQVADQWFQLIDNSPEVFQPAISERALSWYRKALQGLNGLAQDRVEKRIEQLTSSQEEPTEIDADVVENLIGQYFLAVTSKSTRQTDFSVIEFREDREVVRNEEVIGRWAVADGNRIQLTLASDADSPFYFRPKTSRSAVITTRAANGDGWKMTPLFVVSTWEHVTEPLKIFGRRIPGGEETLVFYSNGRLNDPLGDAQWSLTGKNLTIAWGPKKQTVAIVSADGRSYRGKTTTATGFANTTINQVVTGRQLDDAP